MKMKRLLSIIFLSIFVLSLNACVIKPLSKSIDNDTLLHNYVNDITFLEKKQYDLFIEKDKETGRGITNIDDSSVGNLNYYIYDFDGDNENELLLISHKINRTSCLDLSKDNSRSSDEPESYIYAEIFEVYDGNVVKQDEAILFTPNEYVDGYSEMIIFKYNDTIQIGFGKKRVGFWGTGVDVGFCSMKYNGTSFVEIMKEYWLGSGDPYMFENIIDKLNEVYEIPEDYFHQNLIAKFASSSWMDENFEIITKPLSVSINAYSDGNLIDHYNDWKDVTFKISWK